MVVMKMKHFALFIIAVLCCNSAFAGVISVAVKTIPDAVTVAARKSGKALSPAMRNAAETAVKKAVANYGDDVLKTVAHGGLETLEVGAKYGDDFWRLCHNATPDAVRSLALHADDLMPIAKRFGPDFMTLEGKVPGLGSKVVQTFGDDAVKGLSKAPADDIAKLIGYADTHGGRLPVPVNMVADEFINIGTIPDFEKKISTVRSRNVNIIMIYQSNMLFASAYPDGLWE